MIIPTSENASGISVHIKVYCCYFLFFYTRCFDQFHLHQLLLDPPYITRYLTPYPFYYYLSFYLENKQAEEKKKKEKRHRKPTQAKLIKTQNRKL